VTIGRFLALACLICLIAEGARAAGPPELDALVRAYPDWLAGYDATDVIWRDGTRMPLSNGDARVTDAAVALRNGSILDQLSLPYRAGPLLAAPGPGDDPGRTRNRAFFDKMYGDCRSGDVSRHVVRVVWMPRTWGGTVNATSVNGVADRLAAISAELDDLPDALKQYAYPPAGAYNCRTVADTGEPSMHSYGAAIDINVRDSAYWLWRRHEPDPAEVAAVPPIPQEIVDIFERHGFIWGGKWFHYDTGHFEYRPELLGRPGAR
jgi:D-alanyl-D-alanine carboxypeptidase